MARGVTFFSALVVSVAMVACGGRSIAVDSDANGDAGPIAPDTDGGGVVPVPVVDGGTGQDGHSACPASVPHVGDSCAVAFLECEYGSSASISCDTLATCESGAFVVNGPECVPPPPAVAGGDCPASPTSDNGQPCGTPNEVCGFTTGECVCSASAGGPVLAGGKARWSCITQTMDCPYPRPRVGSFCPDPTPSSQGSCDYGACFVRGGTSLRCQENRWEELPSACPLSAR